MRLAVFLARIFLFSPPRPYFFPPAPCYIVYVSHFPRHKTPNPLKAPATQATSCTKHEISVVASLNLDHLDPNISWLTWKNKFLHIVNKHAPLKKRRVSKKRVPWLTRELKYYKRQKAYLKRNATLSNLDGDWAAYKSLKNHYNRLIKNTMRQHYQEKIHNNSGDIKKTWKIINEVINKSKKPIKYFSLRMKIMKLLV